jgi:hypothetical protein
MESGLGDPCHPSSSLHMPVRTQQDRPLLSAAGAGPVRTATGVPTRILVLHEGRRRPRRLCLPLRLPEGQGLRHRLLLLLVLVLRSHPRR